MMAQKAMIFGRITRIAGNKAFVTGKNGRVDCYNLDYYRIMEEVAR